MASRGRLGCEGGKGRLALALLEVLFISKDDFRRQILVYWINLLFTPCACTKCLVERWPAKVRRYEQIQL